MPKYSHIEDKHADADPSNRSTLDMGYIHQSYQNSSALPTTVFTSADTASGEVHCKRMIQSLPSRNLEGNDKSGEAISDFFFVSPCVIHPRGAQYLSSVGNFRIIKEEGDPFPLNIFCGSAGASDSFHKSIVYVMC
jgi:hypothetical protein